MNFSRVRKIMGCSKIEKDTTVPLARCRICLTSLVYQQLELKIYQYLVQSCKKDFIFWVSIRIGKV